MYLMMINVDIGYWFLNRSNTSTMAEKANFIQLKARKIYLNVEIEYFLGIQNYGNVETTSL